MSNIEVLDEYKQIDKMIRERTPLIFVTGGAGTGKSTFINWISNKYDGACLKAAPTGIAAINIEGKTVHSLFRLAPKFIEPDDITVIPEKFVGIYKKANIIIIDEISMVTSNMLDAIDMFLRKNLRNNLPFGGKTIIIVGDCFQLPPIVGNNLSESYYKVYKTPYFFSANVLRGLRFEFVELTQVKRQNDPMFINILNNIRLGIDIQDTITLINDKCRVQSEPDVGAMILSPRNAEVDRKNDLEYRKIGKVKEVSYTGKLEGKYKSDRLPSPMFLDLKVGTQVQFTRNIPESGVVNGTMATVTDLHTEFVTCKLNDTNEMIIVKEVEWEEYDYKFNSYSNRIESVVCGYYKQIPLKLAYASTIHKAQGVTLDKVHLDLGAGCFETGQLYVALSRCRSLEGLTLSRKLRYDDVMVDNNILSFYNDCRTGNQDFVDSKLEFV